MKIISWNVNGIRAAAKKGLMEFISKEQPDILCLQETKAHIEQVEPVLQSLGYGYYHWSSAFKKGYSGVATFYQQGPKDFKKGWGQDQYDSEGRIIITDHESFLLYNIYFPNGGSGPIRHDFKQQFLKDLNQHLKEVVKQGREVIVVGDYNVARLNIDVHDPVRLSKTSGFLPEEKAWFGEFLEIGFIDTFREIHQNVENRYSWWDYRQMSRISNKGWRIDYICATKGLKKNLVTADILDQVEGSDHCPVVATYNFI